MSVNDYVGVGLVLSRALIVMEVEIGCKEWGIQLEEDINPANQRMGHIERDYPAKCTPMEPQHSMGT